MKRTQSMLAMALLIAGSQAFAAQSAQQAEQRELSCNSDTLSVETFVTSQNGNDTLRVAIVDSQGRTQTLFGQAGTGERVALQSQGLKLFAAGGDRAIETPQAVIKIEGSLISLSGQINGDLQCIDLRSDNPWGKGQ